ncbi:hypothetical protein DsansV1_C03g0030621 [Dioscorea sansibarensis]
MFILFFDNLGHKQTMKPGGDDFVSDSELPGLISNAPGSNGVDVSAPISPLYELQTIRFFQHNLILLIRIFSSFPTFGL